MKTLILTRHAKSSWNSDASSDFERPLNQRGMRDAPVMGKRLLARDQLPDVIVSSTANRALSTSRLLMRAMGLSAQHLSTTDSIYEAPLQALLSCIETLPPTASTAMLVGHNPGMSTTCNYLCQEAAVQMPTCAMACLTIDTDNWGELYRDCAALSWYDYPKNGAPAGLT